MEEGLGMSDLKNQIINKMEIITADNTEPHFRMESCLNELKEVLNKYNCVLCLMNYSETQVLIPLTTNKLSYLNYDLYKDTPVAYIDLQCSVSRDANSLFEHYKAPVYENRLDNLTEDESITLTDALKD